MLKQYNFVNSLSFASLALATFIYIAIFINFCKIPRIEKWKRPEVALLYEGIPLMIVNVSATLRKKPVFMTLQIYIFNFLTIDLRTKERFNERYFNYEMRSTVITTAFIQFTNVLSFQKLITYFNYLKSVEMRVFFTRASVSPVLPLADRPWEFLINFVSIHWVSIWLIWLFRLPFVYPFVYRKSNDTVSYDHLQGYRICQFREFCDKHFSIGSLSLGQHGRCK